MSVIIMSRVFYTNFGLLEYKRKNGKIGKVNKVNSKIVMLVLADAANDDGKNSWQAVETIAGKSSLDWRTVTRTLIALRQNGYIWVDGKSEYDTNNYSINLDKIEEIPKIKRYPSTKKRYRKGDRGVTVTKLVCHDDSESIIDSLINIPAIAGDKLCEECKEDNMCEKCEMLKKKIELGTEYGFEFDVKNSKETLKGLAEVHKTEDPTENKKATQSERISAMMQGFKDEYADKLADYPDRCRKPLNYFLHKWNFSPTSVPKKSKSKGGAFATWINGIDELVAISGEKNFELVLDKAYEIWHNRSTDYKNVIDMPQKIKPLFTSCNNIVRQEIAEKMKEEVKKAKEKTEEKKDFVSAEDGSKLLKQLQKSLKKGREE